MLQKFCCLVDGMMPESLAVNKVEGLGVASQSPRVAIISGIEQVGLKIP
jgi:hypothetical protein